MTQKTHNDLDLRRFIRECKKFWWLYCSAAIILFGLAYTYHKVRMPQYTSDSMVIIEDSSGEGAAMAAMASSKGGAAAKMLGFGSADVINETKIMFSHENLINAVHATGLNYTYVKRDGLSKELLYPSTPVVADVPVATLDTLQRGFKIRLVNNGGKFDINVSRGLFGHKQLANVSNISLPYNLKIRDLGVNVHLAPTSEFKANEDLTLDIVISGTEDAIFNISKNITTASTDKNSDAIVLTYTGPNKEQNETLLNNIMSIYNERRLERRRETSLNELNYCTDRLEKLYKQLSDSEEKVEDFKRRNNLAALQLDSASWVVRSIGSRDKIAQVQNQITYYDQVLYTINHDRNAFIVPLANQTPDPLAQQYNTLLAQRMQLERSAKSDHPELQEINAQINDIKTSIAKNYSQIIDLNKRNMASNYSLQGEAKEKMAQIPGLEREMLNLLRDRTIKNELYLYLLQRREAAELKYYSTDTPGFIVDKAYSEVKPSLTKSIVAFVVAILLSIICPTLFLIWNMRRRNRILQPMDLAFIDLEENTIEQSDDNNAFRSLRTELLKHPEINTTYVVNMLSEHKDSTIEQIAQTFKDIDIPAEVITSSTSEDSNDKLLTESFSKHCSAKLQENKILFIEVPAPKHLNDILPLTDSKNASILVILKKGVTKRCELKNILKGQQISKTLILIIH